MKNYTVTFIHNGEEQAKVVEATDCGQAYHKILKQYKGAEIVRGLITRKAAGGSLMWMEYEPLKATVPEPLPKEKFIQEEMPLGDPRRHARG